MKTLKTTALVLGLFALLAGTTTLARAQGYEESYQDDGYNTGNVSLQTFYDELSPYGTWIQDPQYGYVWRPDVDQNEFRPYYTNGRWAMTEYGNTWVSNYDWGWAPFHYGRWVINSYRQWIWLPDTNWGPAWVDWRSGDGYYGWAPMAPSININLSFGRRYSVPEFCWNFIPQASIYINTFPRYDYGRNNVYIRNTTIINNTYVYNRRSYYGGPRLEDIRRATNRNVTVYRYAQSNRPGASRIDNRSVSIYRPRPERGAVDNRSAAPRKFEQGNAGFSRNGRNDNNYSNRDQRGRNNDDNRFGQRNDSRMSQPNRSDNGNIDNRRDNNNQQNNRAGVYNRDANGRTDRANQNFGDAEQRNRQLADRTQERGNRDQQRIQQMQQRNQQDRMNQDQQRGQREVQQRNEQMQQQRAQQTEQQRAQRDQQMQQRNEQMQQQRAQQADQQRAQRDQQMQQRNEQMQQQRSQQADQQRQQQAEQQRAQRDQQRSQQADQQRQQMQQRNEQMQQQRQQQAQPQQQSRGGERGSESGRPTRGGRG
ncbi:DUF6600 domain-containing protein [Pedobacter sp. Leaf176]|uniref:DUF6600 domain-containing protein n=1 Tax=Pedobacter sp. Leaf176 TaxID=1736286 RepID=UPI0006FDCDF3|nr:DUF6600 domain-containing protein [Pedobacter sp. Leaf176]KQR72246.1 hypothetical protein ASF92_02830 [Pedobacter sp. Leaf176]